MNSLPKNESCVALSSDSDMTFMALLSPNLNYIYNPFSMSNFLGNDERAFIDVRALKAELSAGFQETLDLETRYIDFVFLGFLGGTDYGSKLNNAPELSKLWDEYRNLKLTPEYQDRNIITRDSSDETTTIDLEFLDKLLEKKRKEPEHNICIQIGKKNCFFSVKSPIVNLDTLLTLIPGASLKIEYVLNRSIYSTSISLVLNQKTEQKDENKENVQQEEDEISDKMVHEKNNTIFLSSASSPRKLVAKTLAIEKIFNSPGSPFLKLLRENISLSDFDKIQGLLNNANYDENIKAMFLKKSAGSSEARAVFKKDATDAMDTPLDLATKFLQLNVWILNYYHGQCDSYSSHVYLNPRPSLSDISALAQSIEKIVIPWEKDTLGPLIPFANYVAIVPHDATTYVAPPLRNFFFSEPFLNLFKEPSEKMIEGKLEASNALYLKCHEAGALSKIYLEEESRTKKIYRWPEEELTRVKNHFLSFQPTMRFLSRTSSILSTLAPEEIKMINGWELIIQEKKFKKVICVPFDQVEKEEIEERENNEESPEDQDQSLQQETQRQIFYHNRVKQPKNRFSILENIDKGMMQKRKYSFSPLFYRSYINTKPKGSSFFQLFKLLK